MEPQIAQIFAENGMRGSAIGNRKDAPALGLGD